jgi:hypothetical protein
MTRKRNMEEQIIAVCGKIHRSETVFRTCVGNMASRTPPSVLVGEVCRVGSQRCEDASAGSTESVGPFQDVEPSNADQLHLRPGLGSANQ